MFFTQGCIYDETRETCQLTKGRSLGWAGVAVRHIDAKHGEARHNDTRHNDIHHKCTQDYDTYSIMGLIATTSITIKLA